MRHNTAKQDENIAAEIFDSYLSARFQGQDASEAQFLSQCPATQQKELREAIEGADVYLRNYSASHIRPSVLEKTLQGLEELKRKKARQGEWRDQASQVWDLGIADPVAYLAQAMNIPSAAHRVEEGETKLRTYNRGESINFGQNKVGMDRVLRLAKEKSVAIKVEQTLETAEIFQAPVDLKKIVQHLYLVVEEGPMEGDIQGSLVTDGEVGGILINNNVKSKQRRRFTLAHEIGHFVLHRGKHTFRDAPSNLRDYMTSPEEFEANTFAAMLLMPASLLPRDFGSQKPLWEQVDNLVKRFDVSSEAAIRRLIGQSNWRSALVVSKDGVIKWVVPSLQFDGYIEAGRPPHPRTMAQMLLNTSGPEEDGITLPITAWVQGGTLANEEVQVYEQSRRLSSGYVYSLLTVLD